jgi:hypothetical protein
MNGCPGPGAKLILSWIMKARACILIAIWGILLIEPASANFNINSGYSRCGETENSEPAGCKSACSKPVEQEDENDCEGNRCNPLMSCPTGNFYLFTQALLSIAPLNISKEKKDLINDNRIVKQQNECWHPPEII